MPLQRPPPGQVPASSPDRRAPAGAAEELTEFTDDAAPSFEARRTGDTVKVSGRFRFLGRDEFFALA